MEFLDENLSQYCEQHTSVESDLLRKINRETHLEVLQPRMLSGHLQGRVLAMISKMLQPKFILEIGTYTGYSALCMAEGLAADGKLLTIDINPEMEERVKGYFSASPFGDQLELLIAPAQEYIPTMEQSIDLVFIDADKENYGLYYDLVLPKMRSGGILLADNVLWSGKVLNEPKENDHATRSLIAFNHKVNNDPRTENVLLPIRDGVMMIRKK